jgi:hypothetical protein
MTQTRTRLSPNSVIKQFFNSASNTKCAQILERWAQANLHRSLTDVLGDMHYTAVAFGELKILGVAASRPDDSYSSLARKHTIFEGPGDTSQVGGAANALTLQPEGYLTLLGTGYLYETSRGRELILAHEILHVLFPYASHTALTAALGLRSSKPFIHIADLRRMGRSQAVIDDYIAQETIRRWFGSGCSSNY